MARLGSSDKRSRRLRGDYIRPLVLFQAQDRNQDANVETLKAYLLDLGIDERRIRIATGDQRELDDVNLFDPACEVDFIITVEALKEGWDCSFAYVFCSLANVQAATAAEQLLGRVLRMPYARRREDPRLNRAYAHLASQSFSAAARALRDRMVAMGFDEQEASENIEPARQEVLDTELFGNRSRPRPSMKVEVEIEQPQAEAIAAAVPGKTTVSTGSGPATIRIEKFLTPSEKERVLRHVEGPAGDRLREEIDAFEAAHADRITSAEKGAEFVVPALMALVQGELELADTDLLMEHRDWSLLDHSAQLDPGEFDLRQTANTFEIDLDGRHLSVVSRDSTQQLALDIEVEGWSEQGLVRFLARQVRQPDLSPSELLAWITRAVSHLTSARGLPLASLMQCKYVLARKLQERVAAIRTRVRRDTYQQSLFGPEARPEVSYERGFVFREGIFASARKQGGGGYRFTRHFTGPDDVPAFDGTDDGDEVNCARALDSITEVKHWVRNVAQHPDAFWLPLAGGRFYPDFVAELEGGRLLIVEYKGDHLLTADDTREKVQVGEAWERAMDGRGLFLLARKLVDGMQPRDQMLTKIARD